MDRRWAAGALALCLMLTIPPAASKGKPDLQVRSVAARADEVAAGGSLPIADRVTNKGTARAGRSSTRIYLSTDDTKDSTDVKLGTRAVPALGPGGVAKKNGAVDIPDTVAIGAYYLVACADTGKKVAESNEKNNCRASSGTVAVTPPPTDHDLIDEDLESGRIDAETALTYKVFADFGDERLPARYDGDDSQVFESDVLTQVAAEWTTLSEDTRLALEPFLIPPFHENSWLDDTPDPPATPRTAGPDFSLRCGEGLPVLEQWGYVDAAGGEIRIWWLKDNDATDAARAADMAAEIDSVIWPSLTGLMGSTRPLSDDGGSATTTCRGGSNALDISLVDIARSSTTSLDRCDGTWARILFERGLFGGPRAKTMAVLAHEIFHAFQFSYDVSVGCLAPGGQYDWLKEGTAQWIEHHVYPGENTEHPYAQRLLQEPGTPLEEKGSWGYERYYATYLLPFFLETRAGATVVKTMWDNTVGMSSIDAADAAIPGNFQDTWHDFAVYNWNDGPVDEYKTRDSLTTTARIVGSQPIGVGEDKPQIHVEHLAAKYLELTFHPDVAEFEYHNDLAGDPRAGVRAIIYYDDGSYDVKDLSDNAKTVLCIDDGTKRVDRMVLVFSDSGKTPADKLIFKPKFVGIKGCSCLASGRAAYDSGQPGVCQADGNLHYAYTHDTSEDPTQELYQTSTYRAEASATIDLVPSEDDPDFYEDRNSSYDYNGTGHFVFARQYGGCGTETSDHTHIGGGTFKSVGADPVGFVLSEDAFFLSSPVFVVNDHTETVIACGGPPTASDFEARIVAYSCPFEGDFSPGYTFTQTSETPTTKTYSIACTDEREYTDGNEVDHEESVSISGTITLPR